jgi:hypothetical protein
MRCGRCGREHAQGAGCVTNDNAERANDNDRPWRERKRDWEREYHREYMRRRRERERDGGKEARV